MHEKDLINAWHINCSVNGNVSDPIFTFPNALVS